MWLASIVFGVILAGLCYLVWAIHREPDAKQIPGRSEARARTAATTPTTWPRPTSTGTGQTAPVSRWA